MTSTKPRKPFDSHLSAVFYNRALSWSRPFTLMDIAGDDAIAIRKEACRQWLEELVERGELKKTRTRHNTFYEWVN